MKNFSLTYRRFGTAALLIEWPQSISEDILTDIIAFQSAIEKRPPAGLIEIVPTYASLTLFFNELKDFQSTTKKLNFFYDSRISNQSDNKRWIIPVCYEEQFGIDLQEISNTLKVSKQEIIDIHSSQPYRVHFIGFLPGFLYLGGLNSKLHCPRRESPRLRITKGSVGIGGSQTGIYPIDSPGGWNIIGGTPIPLFDSSKTRPCFVRPGDTLKFDPIDQLTYDQINQEIEQGNYAPKVEIL
ncbi:5-oxoprolinase subunit PxpB [Reichenbachiella sp. MALMAid0571]|uniref:5-oxoprolinase subunit PxpB n=1 Tax=Reichenbachiella sp. MALMAid0571 TaxID=3143939 RepID=UPI0032DF93A8